MHQKTVNSMAPKSDRNWCETTPIQPITAFHLSLHPFQATTFTISHFASILNHLAPPAQVEVTHHFLFFYLTKTTHVQKRLTRVLKI